MRGNSGFLRWAIIGFLLVLSVTGGPSRPRRMLKEPYLTSSQESFPTSLNTTQDADMCTQNGKEVLRSSVTCEKKNGCREIETHGECCPKFLCECESNGNVYGNGDKIVDSKNPCEVCVCRGGDINCSALKCYTRNDCKNVTYTPGVCCPEYMNCPPLENVELNSSNETYNINDNLSSTIGTISVESFDKDINTSTFLPTQLSAQPNDNRVGIKIKEITKPEEIRITDDRPKVFPIKSSEIVPTKSSTSLYSTEPSIEPEPGNANFEILPEEISENHSEIEPEIEQHTTFTFDGSADQPIQLESTDLNTIGDVSMGQKIVRQTVDGIPYQIDTTIAPLSTENESSDDILTTKSIHVTVAPVETNSVIHNTSVQQVGNSVVITDRRGQTQSIPLGVVGLQRGEDTYDEDDERKEGRKSDNMESSTTGFAESVSLGQVNEETPSTQEYDTFYYEPLNVTELSTGSEESHEIFVDGVKVSGNSKESSVSFEELNSIITSSEKPLEAVDDSSGFSSIDDFTDKITSASNVYETVINVTDEFEGSSSTSEEVSTNVDNLISSTSQSYSLSSESTTEDDEMVQHDQNINFPHIKDDVSIHGSRMEEDDDESEKNEVELIQGNNQISTTVGSIESALETLKEINDFDDVQARAPGEPLLIPEWERNHTTILSSNIEPSVDDSISHQTDSSSNIDAVQTSQSTSSETSSHDTNYDVESIEDDHTSGPSHMKETNNFNLVLDGINQFSRMQKKIWDSALA